MGKCVCPNCKSNNVIPIMYGYPAPEAIEVSLAGELKIGGCVIYEKDGGGVADRHCKDCEHEWCVDDFVAKDIKKVRFRYWSNWCCMDMQEENQWAFEVFPDGTADDADSSRNAGIARLCG